MIRRLTWMVAVTVLASSAAGAQDPKVQPAVALSSTRGSCAEAVPAASATSIAVRTVFLS